MKRTISAVLAAGVLLWAALTSAVDVSAISAHTAGRVSTRSSALNVRSEASVSSDILTCLERGSMVTLIKQSSDWWRVKYGENLYGFCSADYITPVEACKTCYVNTKSDSLNVRSGAGMSFAVMDSLAKGKSVTVLSQTDSWSKIIYDGVSTGYVKSDYLTDTNPSPYAPVALEVELYKQTDPRWGEVRLGSSYETISSVGCTTTCLAMSESYRGETPVYPDDMQSRLGYTSSGSLYWPPDYATSTLSDGWLETVYDILSGGKPVIVGSRKSSGSQHWVLVTGYEGTSPELEASGFTVNDPATAARKSLSELLDDYPVFMKLAYYR